MRHAHIKRVDDGDEEGCKHNDYKNEDRADGEESHDCLMTVTKMMIGLGFAGSARQRNQIWCPAGDTLRPVSFCFGIPAF